MFDKYHLNWSRINKNFNRDLTNYLGVKKSFDKNANVIVTNIGQDWALEDLLRIEMRSVQICHRQTLELNKATQRIILFGDIHRWSLKFWGAFEAPSFAIIYSRLLFLIK